MAVSKFWRPRPITNHILPLFKIKAVFYLFQSLSKSLLAFQIRIKMFMCPPRKNKTWILKLWWIIFLVPSKPPLSSSQWSLLSTSPGDHLTINALVVPWDKLHFAHHQEPPLACASPALACWGFPVLHLGLCPMKGWARTFIFKSFYKKSGSRSKHRF